MALPLSRTYRGLGTFITPTGDFTMWVCPDDGEMVGDREAHDRWHDEIEERGTIAAIWRLRNGHGPDRRPTIR
jgi:3-oxoacyl-ACP reductase-like protein